jgi:hypothetical protein
MSGVLHPVGPEPARTYWIRRGVLLAVVLLTALLTAVAVANLTKAAVATAPPPPIAPPVASPTPSSALQPSRGGTTAPSATSGAPTVAGTPVVSGSAGTPGSTSGAPSVDPSTSTTRSPAAPPPPATTTTPPAATPPRAATAPSAKPSPTTTVIGTPDCPPGDLRVTLTGDRTLTVGQRNRFTLSLVNGGERTCLTSVTTENFELKIYSGKDRIWSSQDCAKTLDGFDKVLAARADVGWTMTWDGRRSVKGQQCTRAPERPQPGTYWATAQLDGTKPVQLRMIIG